MTLSGASYERKAVGALVLATLLAGLVGATAVTALISHLFDQRRVLGDMQAAITLAETELNGTTVSRSGAMLAPRLFKAATAAEFQSQLQSYVKDVATRHSVAVDTLQIMNAERAGGLNRLSLRLDAVIPNAALGPFLADLATAEPLVLMQSMELRQVVQQANRLNNGGRPDNAMSARLDFTAYAANATPRSADVTGGRR